MPGSSFNPSYLDNNLSAKPPISGICLVWTTFQSFLSWIIILSVFAPLYDQLDTPVSILLILDNNLSAGKNAKQKMSIGKVSILLILDNNLSDIEGIQDILRRWVSILLILDNNLSGLKNECERMDNLWFQSFLSWIIIYQSSPNCISV